MTQQDYEKAKAQCWEDAVLHGALEVDKDLLFDHAFKCGYALGKQEKDTEDDKTLKISKQLFCHLCADADDYLNEHLEEDDSDYGYYQGRSDALHELYRGECKDAEIVIQGWVARDGAGPNDLGLCIYAVKPRRMEGLKRWNGHGEKSTLIDHRLFPDLTWDDDPQEVELIIKRKNKSKSQQ